MTNDIQIIIGVLVFLIILILVNLLVTYLFKEDRIKFLTSLLTVVLVVSNIIVAKTTVILGLVLPSSILIYPLTFLFTISITHLGGIKEASKSIFFAIVIQTLISIVFYLVLIIFPDQLNTIVEANQLRNIIGSGSKELLTTLLPSLLAFGISEFIASGIYTILNKYTYKIIAADLAILIPILIDSAIFSFLTMFGDDSLMFNLANKFIASVAYTLIMIIMFMIFTINPKKTK